MPFVAQIGSEVYAPMEVPPEPDATLRCPECHGEFSVRESHFSGGQHVKRHFVHKQDDPDCSNESSVHEWMKAVAVKTLRQRFENSQVQVEKKVGNRVADVICGFPTPVHPYGRGIIVEAQHKNQEKEIRDVSENYLDEGYSVFWAYQSDFDSGEMGVPDKRKRIVWPDAVPSLDEHAYRQYEPNWHDPKPLEIDLTLPEDYYYTRALEIVSPHRINEYREIESRWLGGGPEETAWISVYREVNQPGGWIELWQKDEWAGDIRHLPMPIHRDELARLDRFASEVDDALHDDNTYTEASSDQTFASISLSGSQFADGRLCLEKPLGKPIQLALYRTDQVGGERRVGVGVDYDDGETLATVVDHLRRCF